MATGDIKVNVGGVWKDLSGVHVKAASAWKEVNEVWVKTGGVWKQVWLSSPPLPSGAIVPYRGGGTPSGFTVFSAADSRFIVGAGSSYGVGSTGGSNTTSVSGGTNTTGNHSGGSAFNVYAGSGGAAGRYTGNSAVGNHSHTWSTTVGSEDVYKSFRMIKATSEQSLMPAQGCMLAHTTLNTAIGGISNVENVDRFMRADAAYGGTGGSGTSSGSVGSSSNGAHTHLNANRGNGDTQENYTNGYTNYTTGSHSHTVSFSATLNTKRRYLTAWTNASADFPLQTNAIVMWESGTPPAGWAICDGANGTPDMRDYFVRLGSTGQANGTSGNNSVTYSVSTNSAGNHSHHGGYTSHLKDNYTTYHSNSTGAHSHSTSVGRTITQRYYALYFIMNIS